MKEIKTAEEMPNFLYEDSNGIIRLGYHGDTNITDEWIEWKNKFADQFKPKWIPVSDRLPEKYKPVICFGFGYQIFICDAPFDEAITHWMPLPQPPTNDIEG